jgi:hypothetical protein
MPITDYSNCKIYKIISPQTDKIYIGSTCQSQLSKRLGQHKQQYKNYLGGSAPYIASLDIIQYGDAKIILIDSFPECKNREEQYKIEQSYIDKLDCINKNRAYSTIEYKKECASRYNRNNYLKFREKRLEKAKIWREENVEKRKKYREENSEKIKEYSRAKVNCDICHKSMTKRNLPRHKQTIHK